MQARMFADGHYEGVGSRVLREKESYSCHLRSHLDVLRISLGLSPKMSWSLGTIYLHFPLF
jgi:hypothetical protein